MNKNQMACAPRRKMHRHRPHQYFQHSPRVNVLKSENGYTIEMAIPGIKKSDVSIAIENDQLTIEHKIDSTREDKFIQKGFDFSGFKRSFKLSNDVDHGKIEASFDAGILSIYLPLSEQAMPRSISIK